MEELEVLQEEEVQTLELYKSGNDYLNEGFKVVDLWSMDTRVVSSFDKEGEQGGLTQGRIDIDWAYWNMSNIKPHRFLLILANDTEFDVATLEELHSNLNFKTPINYRNDGATMEFDMSSDTLGISKIQMVYVDENDWVQVLNEPSGIQQKNVKLNMKIPFKFFGLTLNSLYYEWEYHPDECPIPLVGISTYISLGSYTLKFRVKDINTLELYCNRPEANLTKAFIKYI